MPGSVENYVWGAVDSRSNPLNLPRDRALLCRNWIPNAGGWLELRKGYEAIPMQPTFTTPIHSLAEYQLWSGERYLLAGQGPSLNRITVPSTEGDPALSNNLLVNGNYQRGEATSNGWSRFVNGGSTPGTYRQEGNYTIGGVTYTSEHVICGQFAWNGIIQLVDVEPGQTYCYAVLLFNNSVGAVAPQIWVGDRSLSPGLNSNATPPPSGSTPPFYAGSSSPSGQSTSGKSRWELKRGQITIPANMNQIAFIVQGPGGCDYFVQGAMFWKGSAWQDFREGDRVGTIPGVGKNMLPDSEDFSAWSGQAQIAVVTRNVAMDPNGNKTADLAVFPAATTSTCDLASAPRVTVANANREFVFSVWMRADSPQTIDMLIEDVPWSATIVRQTKNVTTGWQRFSVTGVFGSAVGNWTRACLRSLQGQASKSIYLWGAQLEYGSTPTAYVASTNFSKWDTFFASNQVHIGNGTQLMFFDGKKLRKNGVRSLTATEAAAVQTAMSGGPGWPISTVGGSQPGYQLYCALYNPVTGAIGNRVKIGSRLKVTLATTGFAVSGLPDLSNEDGELVKLIGVTTDGDDVPYAICDSGFNWQYASNSATTFTSSTGLVDFSAELPSRNGTPPPMDKFCRIGDRVLGCGPASPFVYVSGSEQDLNNSTFIGRPEQAWSPSDVLTFPTREVPTCIQKFDSALVFSGRNMDMVADLGGYFDWQETIPVGCVGQRAYANTVHGKFWVTGEKQLATITSDGPLPISEEYQKGLLRKIGDQYLADVEIVHYLDPDEMRDELVINCVDADGNAFHVIHDFKLRDERSPYGQGREVVYSGILAQPHTLAQVKDETGKPWIYAGGADGRIYRLNSGYTDNGEEITGAELISLVNGGPDRISIPELEIFGDHNLKVSIMYSLSGTADNFEQLERVSDPVDNDNFRSHYQIVGNSEIEMAYLRFQLDGHSTDAPTSVTDPPNLPLEWYGKVYAAKALLGTARGA